MTTGGTGVTAGTVTSTTGTADRREMRRILASSIVGTSIEYYDFILYATAASLVFQHVFFAGAGPGIGLLLSFGTLATGYIARPLGGLLFGHLGDRLGRKSMLIATLVLMGTVSVLIGLLPTTAQIGWTAPVLLVLLRVLQGIAVGGEWGGAMLLGFERSTQRSRGFAASFAYMGAPAGTIVATLVLSAASTLPREAFLSWGWRIPFLVSAVLVGVGLLIRMKIAESAVFTEARARAADRRAPVVEIVTRYPRQFVTGIVAGLAGQTAQGVMGAWALSYAVSRMHLSQTAVLNVKALAGAGTIIMIVIAARMADRLGRRRVMLAGVVAAIVLAYPIMFLLSMGELWALFVALFLGLAVIQGFAGGPYGAFAAELYPTRVRYSGTSLSYQIASTIGSGLMPVIATALVMVGDGSLWLVGLIWVAFSALAGVALLATSEGKDRDIRAIS